MAHRHGFEVSPQDFRDVHTYQTIETSKKLHQIEERLNVVPYIFTLGKKVEMYGKAFWKPLIDAGSSGHDAARTEIALREPFRVEVGEHHAF